jgi:hypothetical protein
MALAAASPFASFDITDKSQIYDISPVLAAAVYLDLNLLSRGISTRFDVPVEDTVYYWNQEALNARTATVGAISLTSFGTTLVVTDGQETRFSVGDEVIPNFSGSTEVIQVTAVAGTGSLTVTRAYGGSTAAALPIGTTLGISASRQEGSDISTDGSVPPTVYSNSTQIFFAKDLQISRSQRNRRMATIAMDVERQLANRGIELKFDLTRACIYGEQSGTAAGSDTAYRTMKGMRAHFRQYGLTNSTAESLGTSLNAYNTTAVNTGKYPDRLLIGTGLVSSISAIDSTLRRLVETDTEVGYQVQTIQLQQGNKVEVIIDGRVNTGDAFLYAADQVTAHPFVGSGMFVIAATDFVDGVKRRLGAEWGLKVQHPECGTWLSAKT